MTKEWKDFDKFGEVLDKYLPRKGEGATMASQLSAALSKIVYRWFNDGDVYDDTTMTGWGEDLSSYANWIYRYIPEVGPVLRKVHACFTDEDYTNLLYNVSTRISKIIDFELLDTMEARGSIYDCDGPFSVTNDKDDDDEDDEVL